MALILFLFKVSNLDSDKPKVDVAIDNEDETTSVRSTAPLMMNENTILLSAKVIFRGLSLWSNNVPIRNGTAIFLDRTKKPRKFNFNLASPLSPDDKVRIELHTITLKRKRQKMIGVLEIILEALMISKYIDLPEEIVSDSNNHLTNVTAQLKLYYTSPDIDKENAAKTTAGLGETVDWRAIFDDEGRHGGHRYRYVTSKKDSRLKKLRTNLVRRPDDADTDSYSDSDFNNDEEEVIFGELLDEKHAIRMEHTNLELLEKSLGRFQGNIYEVKEWQIMVHVIQGRDFPGLDLNPYVVVEIDNQKRSTNIHRCSNSPYFGEFFTFDFTLPATKFMEKVIFFKVHHSRKIISAFTDTKPVGIFRLDVATVYNEKEHAFEKKWAQLGDPDNTEVQSGYLLVSLSVAERGTSFRNILGELGQDFDEFSVSKTLVPAAMPRRLFPVQIKITFFTAAELPEMMTDFLASVSKKILHTNTWEPVDPYVEVTYNTLQITTSHQNGTTPVWGEALYLIGTFPPLVRTIKISLKDHAAVQQDRIISTLLIDLFSISESNPAVGFLPTLGPTWMFLYGSPREYSIKKEQDGLSEGMGEGVCYKGRLLMQIESHPVSGADTSQKHTQKESGVQFPEAHIFPMKRSFLLFGCIYDVTMIDKEFGNAAIAFELSIGPSGYQTPEQLVAATQRPVSSLTQIYPCIPIDNNKMHYRLPIDLKKPIIYTKYTFHDYIYRMNLSNRLKYIADRLFQQIRELEAKMSLKVSDEILLNEYRKIEQYIHTLPCGCADQTSQDETFGVTPMVHPNLWELLNAGQGFVKMNSLDIKRRKRLLNNLETMKTWITKQVDFDESKQYEIIKDLDKVARSFQQMANDAQPALPDIFLWMIADNKRVAYARMQPDELLFNLCSGEKGLQNGRIQTIFLKTPRSTDQPIKASTNAKIQIFLWLGIEEYEPYIFKQLPAGFDMPSLPLNTDNKYIRYSGRTHYELRCHCYKARSLTAADETGLSDPFLSITVGNETQTTPILVKSLCPQWNITLVFKNLIHIGSPDTAEKIIGNVVVECYDYDENSDEPELIGRFCTTAKPNLTASSDASHQSPFKWYEFKFGDKRAGELLAVFELIEVDPETKESPTAIPLSEIPINSDNYPSSSYVTKLMKNKTYEIPSTLIPDLRTYEIEVMFWGLRECRILDLQPIQQAEVIIECAGARLMRIIRDISTNPNFQCSPDETDKYKLLVKLPNDNNFWPHLSILCIQHRLFGMKEVVGNLVVTDLQKYLMEPLRALTPNEVEAADAINDLSKTIPYDFNRVRRSVIDAYEAVLTAKDKDFGKKKLVQFEKETGREQDDSESQVAIVNADALDDENMNKISDEQGNQSSDEAKTLDLMTDGDRILENPPLTALDKLKRDEMEKAAGWWTKYYASKAKLRLSQKPDKEFYEDTRDGYDVYADFFEEEKIVVKRGWRFWKKAKKVFSRAGNAAKRIESLRNKNKKSTAMDESLDVIEIDRLKELTLLQTFDIIETELENVKDYEGFTDALDTFPLYKGKGSNRSDEVGSEKRIFAKFKGKFRIHEIETPQNVMLPRTSVAPIYPNIPPQTTNPFGQGSHHQMLQFDYNKNPITLKCRLYVIKAILYRGWDQAGKADPFLRITLNNQMIIDDVKGKILNTLEPVFGKSFEFEVKLPIQSILRVQIWDWDMTSSNDLIGETKLDIENRWFSCHRATCGLPKRYDSSGYNAWRDAKKPSVILSELCRSTNIKAPVYSSNFRSVTIADQTFECDPDCVEFALSKKSPMDLLYRKVPHESPEDYIRQNTALTALHGWGKRLNSRSVLVGEHIESRSIFNPEYPDLEQGKIEMWLDFFPMSRPPATPLIDITPPKPSAYQLRVTIWNTSDVELNDENILTGEKTSDIYVKAWILGEKIDAQQTDIHYRSLTGDGNFNWRFVFDFNYLEIEEKIVYETKDNLFQVGNTTKKIPPRLIIRVYDADFLSADDFLGECILNLTHLPISAKVAKKCKEDILLDPKHQSVNLFVTKRVSGWWPMIAPVKVGEIRDKSLIGGKVEAEISLVSSAEAEQNPVGKAREAPQPLDEPNRPKTSFLWFTSPWKTFRYIIWRNFKWTIIFGIILFIVVVFLLLGLWSFPGEVIRQLSTKIFGTGK